MPHDALPIERDDNDRVISTRSSNNKREKIEGPLGIWPFPIINLLIQISNNDDDNDSNIVITELHRDDEGRLTGLEEIEL